ncbi:MAG TPA: hypothetical protein VEJ36_01090 [Nitrososphaerales archaeon]|nr:hypothetical protein [Nitrososphaerales archaeon]
MPTPNSAPTAESSSRPVPLLRAGTKLNKTRDKRQSRGRRLAAALTSGSAAINLFIAIVFLKSAPSANRILGVSSQVNGLILRSGEITAICGLGILVGAWLQLTGTPKMVKVASLLTLALNFVTIFSSAGGFIIGFVAGVLGAILGLRWRAPTLPAASA